MPTKTKNAQTKPMVEEEDLEQEEPTPSKKRDPITNAINTPSSKAEFKGKRVNWAELRDSALRGQAGTIFNHFKPDKRMTDPDQLVIAYVIPHAKGEAEQVEVIFDENYPCAYLRWALADMDLSNEELDVLVDEYKSYEEREKAIILEAELRKMARALHEQKGDQSKGEDFYYEYLKNIDG